MFCTSSCYLCVYNDLSVLVRNRMKRGLLLTNRVAQSGLLIVLARPGLLNR